MNFVELLVSLQWNKNYNTFKNSKSLLFKLEALYQIWKICLLAVIAFYTHFVSIFYFICNFPENLAVKELIFTW